MNDKKFKIIDKSKNVSKIIYRTFVRLCLLLSAGQGQEKEVIEMQESSSFDRIDIETAKSQYDAWAAKKYETLDEFLLRKRKMELNNLVKKVIDNELSESEKEIVRLHWYDGKNLTQTAKELGITKATVSKKLSKINDIVFDKLKYAIEYRFGRDYLPLSAVIVKSRDPYIYSVNPEGAAKRIRHLRVAQALSLEDVSDMTRISVGRLDSIEKAEKDATATDLAKLAAAFRTSTDYIVFGKERMWQR